MSQFSPDSQQMCPRHKQTAIEVDNFPDKEMKNKPTGAPLLDSAEPLRYTVTSPPFKNGHLKNIFSCPSNLTLLYNDLGPLLGGWCSSYH